jgi:predicted nucleotidyltransferase
MNRASILSLLSEHLDDVRESFGVGRLSLFGSAARDELRAESDVDILVEFSGSGTFERYFGLKDYLEGILGRPLTSSPPGA